MNVVENIQYGGHDSLHNSLVSIPAASSALLLLTVTI